VKITSFIWMKGADDGRFKLLDRKNQIVENLLLVGWTGSSDIIPTSDWTEKVRSNTTKFLVIGRKDQVLIR
jgi:hypothetical protein